MHKARLAVMVAITLVLVAGVLIYSTRRSGTPAPIVGVVRATEIRVEPEVNGQLVSIAVAKGAQVQAGDVLARLSAVELTAQADQARAALASAIANRNNVYAGVRREQVDSLKAAIAKASAALDYVQAQLTEPARWRARALSLSSPLTRPKRTLQARVPMWRRPRRITMRPWQVRPKRNARSPTRRCRPRQPPSPYSNDASTR